MKWKRKKIWYSGVHVRTDYRRVHKYVPRVTRDVFFSPGRCEEISAKNNPTSTLVQMQYIKRGNGVIVAITTINYISVTFDPNCWHINKYIDNHPVYLHVSVSTVFFKIDFTMDILQNALKSLIFEPRSTRKWISDNAIRERLLLSFPSLSQHITKTSTVPTAYSYCY